MAFASPRLAGFVVIAALTLPTMAGRSVVAIVDDPQRWSKLDVYLCIAAAAYALGVVALYLVSAAFRRYCATRLTWWQCVYLNPYILLAMSAIWVRYHDPVFPVIMFALLGWFIWRQSKSQDPLRRAQRSSPGADVPIPPIEPRGP